MSQPNSPDITGTFAFIAGILVAVSVFVLETYSPPTQPAVRTSAPAVATVPDFRSGALTNPNVPTEWLPESVSPYASSAPTKMSGCGTPDIALKNGQVWAACNVGAITAYDGTPIKGCGGRKDATNDCAMNERFRIGGLYVLPGNAGEMADFADAVCPVWYRIAKMSDFEKAAEAIGETPVSLGKKERLVSESRAGIFRAVLKLPLGGFGEGEWETRRVAFTGAPGGYLDVGGPRFYFQWTMGRYWLASEDGKTVDADLMLDSEGVSAIPHSKMADMFAQTKRTGKYSVRCIRKDTGSDPSAYLVPSSTKMPGCDTPDIAFKDGPVWAACNLGATTAYDGSAIRGCSDGRGSKIDCAASERYRIGKTYAPSDDPASRQCPAGYRIAKLEDLKKTAEAMGIQPKPWWTEGTIFSYDAAVREFRIGGSVPNSFWDRANMRSVLKLPLAGYFDGTGKGFYAIGSVGNYWLLSDDGKDIGRHFDISTDGVSITSFPNVNRYSTPENAEHVRNSGYSIRCVRDDPGTPAVSGEPMANTLSRPLTVPSDSPKKSVPDFSSYLTVSRTKMPGCDTADIAFKNGQVWGACNLGATKAYDGYPVRGCERADPNDWKNDCGQKDRYKIGSLYAMPTKETRDSYCPSWYRIAAATDFLQLTSYLKIEPKPGVNGKGVLFADPEESEWIRGVMKIPAWWTFDPAGQAYVWVGTMADYWVTAGDAIGELSFNPHSWLGFYSSYGELDALNRQAHQRNQKSIRCIRK